MRQSNTQHTHTHTHTRIFYADFSHVSSDGASAVKEPGYFGARKSLIQDRADMVAVFFSAHTTEPKQ